MRSRFLVLLAALLLAACSTLSLGYQQLPRLAGWWIDRQLDLDRPQRAQLDTALAQMHAWHRREELPRLLALLRQADGLWSGGVSEAELLQLEQEATASMERSLVQAAPLATPLLASLKPAQWAHLNQHLRERVEEWRERQQDEDANADRGKRFASSLERWLGDLERPLRRQARELGSAWPIDTEGLEREWRARQQLGIEGLQAWARGEHLSGTRLLMASGGRDPARLGPLETARKQAVMSTLLQLLNSASPEQQARARARWAKWHRELEGLR